jgi:demethylmenaquinone methyltransferase/2-methoxy-6-polyprenyl-1,4-benzoquinol methylase
VSHDELDALLAEQTAYYRARADEYDETSAIDPGSRAQLVAALDAFAPGGRVLELACGTGEWTAELVRHAADLTAVDAAPEMIALNRRRVGRPDVRYVQADLFTWTPAQRYDVVFFSAWLSHVPPQRIADFWERVEASLGDSGRVFVIDELPAAESDERVLTKEPAPAVERVLSSGARYRAVKVFYSPEQLTSLLVELGWEARVQTVGRRFYYAIASRSAARRPSRAG